MRRLVTAEDVVQTVQRELGVEHPVGASMRHVAADLRSPHIGDRDAIERMREAHAGPLASAPAARAALGWLAMVQRVAFFDGAPLDSDLADSLRAADPWNELSFAAELQRARYRHGLPWQRGLVPSLQDPRVLNRIPSRWHPETNRSINGEPDALVWQLHHHSPRLAADYALTMARSAPDPTAKRVWARIGLSATHRYVSIYPRTWRIRGTVSPRTRIPIGALRSQRHALAALQQDVARGTGPVAAHLPSVPTDRTFAPRHGPAESPTAGTPSDVAAQAFGDVMEHRQQSGHARER